MKNALIAAVAFAAIGLFIAFVQKRQRDEDARMSQLMPNPEQAPTDDDVKRLVEAGEKIMAIKVYRKIHGGGLKEAKDVVDKMTDRKAGKAG